MRKLFVVLFVLAAAGVFAQQKYALVIGNGAYTSVTKLNNPANDARDMEAALKSLGWTVDMVINGNLDQMEGAAIRLKNRLAASQNSYGFLFYAGHGVQSGGVNYLIPVDANIQSENFLRQRAVSLQALLDELNDAGNELNMVVLDACRDNPFSWKRSGTRGLQVVGNQPAKSIIVYATSAGSTAEDGTGRNSPFTTHLLRNMKTPGLTVNEIFLQTMGDVMDSTNDQQVPGIYTQYPRTAYLGARPQTAQTQQPAPAPVQPAAPPLQPAPTPAPKPTPVMEKLFTISISGKPKYSSDGRFIIISAGTSIRIIDAGNGREIRTITMPKNHSTFGIAVSPDNQLIASCGGDKKIRLWNMNTGREVRTISVPGEGAVSLAFSPDGQRILSGNNSGDGRVIIWNVNNGRRIRTVSTPGGWTRIVAYSPNGQRFLSDYPTIDVWDAEGREKIRTLGSSYAAAWSPASDMVALGSNSNRIISIKNVETGQEVRTFSGHEGEILDIAWSPNGRYIASFSNDDTIRIWDFNTGQAIETLSLNTDITSRFPMYVLAWSPDGKRLAISNIRGMSEVWNIAE